MPKKTPRQYWLFKSEPESFSIDDLAAAEGQTTYWNGVRNYQARNFLRDSIHAGDRVLYYHSNADPLAIVGACEVVRAGYPDHTAWDASSPYFDPKSSAESPTWFMVDIKLLKKFRSPVTREQLAACPELQQMELLRRGSRLSIQPVTATEFEAVLKLAGEKLK